jgi:hypothetical protein
MLSTVGFFREQSAGSPSSVFEASIHDCVRNKALGDEDKICRYVDSGVVVMDVMDAELDVISGDHYISGASSILTDGKWIWRKDFAYYLRRYELAIPDEFTAHIRSSEYVVPTLSRECLIEVGDYVLAHVVGGGS